MSLYLPFKLVIIRTYKERALRNEEALEAVSANLASKSVKSVELESEADLLHCKLEKLLRDNENLGDTVARLRRWVGRDFLLKKHVL